MILDFDLKDIILEELFLTDKPDKTHKNISCTSVEKLYKNLKISNPLYFTYGHSNQKRLNRDALHTIPMTDYLTNNYGGKWRMTGSFKYLKDNFMGWHTNNNSEGVRCYFSYSFEDNSNIFRYRNPYTEEVIDSYDKIGWNVRLFTIDKSNPFWHCVIANSTRYSFGFNNSEPSEKLIKEIKLCLQSQSETESLNNLKQIGL